MRILDVAVDDLDEPIGTAEVEKFEKYMFLMRLICISACEAPSFRSCCDGRPDHQFCILSTSAAASVQPSDGLYENCALQSPPLIAQIFLVF